MNAFMCGYHNYFYSAISSIAQNPSEAFIINVVLAHTSDIAKIIIT